MPYDPVFYANLTPATRPSNLEVQGTSSTRPVSPEEIAPVQKSFTDEIGPALRGYHADESNRSLLGTVGGALVGGAAGLIGADGLSGGLDDVAPYAGVMAGGAAGLGLARAGHSDRFIDAVEQPAHAAAERTQAPGGSAFLWHAYKDGTDEEPAAGGVVYHPASQALAGKSASLGQTAAVVGGGVAAGLLGAHAGGQAGEWLAPDLGIDPGLGKDIGQFAGGIPASNMGAFLTGAALRPDIAKQITPKTMPAIAAGAYDPGTQAEALPDAKMHVTKRAALPIPVPPTATTNTLIQDPAAEYAKEKRMAPSATDVLAAKTAGRKL